MRVATVISTIFKFLWAVLVAAGAATPSAAYEPEEQLRQEVTETVRDALLARTPPDSRFSITIALSNNLPFMDYERLARDNGYDAYDGCTIATFAEVTSRQISSGQDMMPAQIGSIYEHCAQSSETFIGRKPIDQSMGDRAIVTGMWRRYLELTAKRERNDSLLSFVRDDATASIVGDTETTVESAPSSANADRPEGTIADDSGNAPPPPLATNQQNNVERLVIRTETRYGLSGVYVDNAAYLLLADGSFLSEPVENPYTFDVGASKRNNPKKWGQWQWRGGQLEVTRSGKSPDLWKTFHFARPATGGFKLDGRFQSSDSFGGDEVFNFNTVSFERDGRFSWASLKGGNTVWRPAYSDTNSAGHYEIDKHVIRFRFNDGTVREYSFGLYPKDDDHFFVGSNHFARMD